MTRSIHNLLDDMRSPHVATSARAGRDLLQRHADCLEHIDSIAEFLHDDNAAIADIAYRTLERIGEPVLGALLRDLPNTKGTARNHSLSLIAGQCDDPTLVRIFGTELASDDDEHRFHAANCVGRRLACSNELDSDARSLLDRAIAVLETSRSGELRALYGTQSRMTLRKLGLLDHQ